MKELCKELGMRFYVSDAHFKECCDNACCCGLPPEWNYVRGHFGGALQIAKRKGYVTFSEIHKDMKHWEGFDAVDAEGCQFCGGSTASTAKFLGLTMAQYLRYLWNTPKSGKSPYKLFDRVLVPEGKDEHGDLIYRYNEEVTFEKIKNERDIDVTKV
jgi:hypothetical protein